MLRSLAALVAFACLLAASTPGHAQDEVAGEAPPRLEWQPGPLVAPIADGLAEIDVPQGFVFLDQAGTAQLMELTGNPVGGTEVATIAPTEGGDWFVIFEWDEIGWVDDSEQDALDTEAMLTSLQRGNEAANEERRKRGWSTLELVGWAEPPHYDPETNNLTWSIEGRSEGQVVLNRLVKLLGRRGVMSATLVGSPEELVGATPQVDAMLADYRFRPGSTYAEYLPGTDTAAKVGLTALVVGGGAAALAKSGLLAKFWKPLAVGAVALLAGLKRLFGRGRKEEAAG
ncbi:MAG: DUF2167 domain-containing protein [Myxococcota bacterium]